jgi:hypothetical protein
MSSDKHLLPFLCFAHVAIGLSISEGKAKSMPGSAIGFNRMVLFTFVLIKEKSRFSS